MRSASEYMRTTGLVNIGKLKETPFCIIGCGSLGSFTATMLAHMGATKITLYDDDVVEPHNLPVQFLHRGFLGEKKAEALKTQLDSWHPDLEVTAVPKKFEQGSEASQITIMCVDSLKARKLIFSNLIKQPSVEWILDTRAGGNTAAVYTLPSSDFKKVKFFKTSLQGEADPLPCTERMSLFIATQVASLVCNQVRNILRNDDRIAFELIYDANLMDLMGGLSEY